MTVHSLWPSMQSVPNEFLELYYPLIIERYESIEDSGGPGYYRGGNGLRIHYRFLAHGEVGLHDDRWLTKVSSASYLSQLSQPDKHQPWGVTGGEPGMVRFKVILLP
jgi:N-methylhydantoinase B/oxoprolinase/acetone carboxylase alpha subunit